MTGTVGEYHALGEMKPARITSTVAATTTAPISFSNTSYDSSSKSATAIAAQDVLASSVSLSHHQNPLAAAARSASMVLFFRTRILSSARLVSTRAR